MNGLSHKLSGVTGEEAAELIAPLAGSMRFRVLRAIAGSTKGLTDQEIQWDLGLPGDTERPRRVELHDLGWIETMPGFRRLTNGRRARVWVLTEEGRQEWIAQDHAVMCPRA